MFEIINVTEMRKSETQFHTQRNQKRHFIKELLKEIHEFTFVS